MIYIRTSAYNAEKTLERTIKSVLGQTYGNFKYYLMDHGSSDKTGEIVRKYAESDNRIIPFYNKVNREYDENPDFWNLPKRIPQGDYFCILDADDTYEPDFFEEMLHFMEDNDLEMAACGTAFVDGKTGSFLYERILPQDVVIKTAESLEVMFPYIYWNFRQGWGKLYSAKAAGARFEICLPEWFPTYGGDTINVLESAKAVERIGVKRKVLHNYSVSVKSYSYRWNPKRTGDDILLYEKGREFLMKTCGRISERNQKYLYSVYFNAIMDTVDVLFGAQLELGSKLRTLRDIMAEKVTQEMFRDDLSVFGETQEKKNEFLQSLFSWMEGQETAYTPENISELMAVYEQFNADISKLVTDEELLWYMYKIPQLMSAVAVCDYDGAAKIMRRFLSDDVEETFPVTLAQTLAAILNNMEEYVQYEKILIKNLIRCGSYDQAEKELEEWEEILQDDKEFKNFRKELERGTNA